MPMRVEDLHEITPRTGFSSWTAEGVKLNTERERSRETAFEEGLKCFESILAAMIENAVSPVVQFAVLECGPQAGSGDSPVAPRPADMRHNNAVA